MMMEPALDDFKRDGTDLWRKIYIIGLSLNARSKGAATIYRYLVVIPSCGCTWFPIASVRYMRLDLMDLWFVPAGFSYVALSKF